MAPEEFLGNQTLATTTTPAHAAVIFGVTGLVGKELARRLTLKPSWKVYGIARRPEPEPVESSKYHFISCDLLDPLETQQKVSVLEDVTHMFWVTWASQFPLDSPECCQQNKAMMGNALNALLPRATSLRHVSLQTGLKHYVSLTRPHFDGREVQNFDEECPRAIANYNFYYDLEDLLRERLAGKVAWSVHRPGLIMGSSYKTLYNFMGSLCVYGTMCKHLNLPFTFGGTRERWEEVSIDGSDARLVADQHIWAATTDSIASRNGQAFNSVNGPSFTWREIWPSIGKRFGLQVTQEAMFQQDYWYSSAMADKNKVWREIVKEEGLVEMEMEDLANWGFLDVLFRCPVKLLGTRDKADKLGFGTRYKTLDSIYYWIDFMRHEKLIP
ncbi:hypothetical protein CDL15_Pgr010355 [Punica granatum]|uniref:PRISE-like Rossmann-fold domain-containing protein n=1 Tax=Punica granatum TaxID=22663 RepID=A0A218W1I8_PUNGR|nr:hypothetical protein CDL15_Pgr010355 [Punica granatum]PKI31864.1 hypothetical protein CRG98_047750 [Punica granatum]